ncbi:MAG: type II secretion system F family protein [Opitutaceae bacterium]
MAELHQAYGLVKLWMETKMESLRGFLQWTEGKWIARGSAGRFVSHAMAFITSAPAGQSAAARSAAGPSPKKQGFLAAQALAKQKAFEKKSKKYKLPLGELALFTQQLSSLLNAGLPLVQCLEALQDQTEDPVFRIIIRDVRVDISAGNSFSSAVKKFPRSFNSLFISMIEAGEASGALAEILSKVAVYFESTVKLTKKVKSAMTYPIAVIGLAVALVNVLLIFVIPVFAAMFADFGAKLPAPTQMLIDLSNFMKAWWWAIGIGCYAVYFIGKKFVATPRGRRAKDIGLMRAPIFGGLIHKIALSRFCRTYATLMRSGVPILRTLEIVASASNKVQIEDACAEIAKHVSQGGQVSDVLAVNPFFPPMMKHMVKAGESTGNVDGMMNKIADFYDTESEATVASLTSLIEPMLIVFLGVVVGGIVMAMFLPIFQLGAVAGGLQ